MIYQLHTLTLTGEEIENLRKVLDHATQYGYYSKTHTDSLRSKLGRITLRESDMTDEERFYKAAGVERR